MKINPISINNGYISQKNNISNNSKANNTSFGNYDRKYDWCLDNPLISKHHPAVICPENIDFENMEIAHELFSSKRKLEKLYLVISRFVNGNESCPKSKMNEAVKDFDFLYALASTKVDENGNVKSFVLDNDNGKTTECKFDSLGNLKYLAVGFSQKGGNVTIDEFTRYTDNRIAKFKNVVFDDASCSFDDGFAVQNAKSFKFSPSEHNKKCAMNDVVSYLQF